MSSLSKALKEKKELKPEGLVRIELAYRNCSECKKRIEFVKTKWEKWSMLSMWAAGCDRHQPWMRARIDVADPSQDWPGYVEQMQQCAVALKEQNQFFDEIIIILQRIQAGERKLEKDEITLEAFEAARSKLEAKIPGELLGVDVITLQKWASYNSADMVKYEKEIEQAFFTPPKNWT